MSVAAVARSSRGALRRHARVRVTGERGRRDGRATDDARRATRAQVTVTMRAARVVVSERRRRRRRASSSSASSNATARAGAIFFACWALASGTCEALITNVGVRLDSTATATASAEISTFGFAKGGTLDVTAHEITPASAEVWAVSCPKGELQAPLDAGGLGSPTCAAMIAADYVATRGCQAALLSNQQTVRITKTQKSREVTIVVLCDANAQVDFSGTFVKLNPKSGHVGFEYAPAARMFAGFIIIWVIVFAVKGAYFWKRRDALTWLHVLLLAPVVTRLVWLIAANRFWINAENTGAGLPLSKSNFDAPTGGGTEALMFIGCLSLNQSTFFCTWIIVSYGWLITRRRMESWEVFVTNTFFFGMFGVNILCRTMFSSLVLIGFYLAYPGLLATTVANATRNLKSLRLQHLMISHSQNPGDAHVVEAKELIFKRMQGLVFWYVAAKITSSVTELFLEDDAWVRYLLGELIDFGAAITLTHILRPRTQANPFNTHFVRDWEAMFEGTMNSIADRIATLGLSPNEIPRPEFYVAYVGGRRERIVDGDVVIDISDDEWDSGVGCFHLILVENPCTPETVLQHLAIASPDRELT